MDSYLFEKKTSLSAKTQTLIEQGHIKDEAKKGIVCGYSPFILLAKSHKGEVLGALQAYTAFAEVYIDDLWVHPSHRNLGIGRQLLKELERRFEGKGYNNINLVTSAFQAPDFYKKCGFEIEFTRQNKKNPALSKVFFIKYFQNERQTKGLKE